MTATAPELVDKKQSFDTSIDEIPKCPETMWNADSIDLQQAAASAPSRAAATSVSHGSGAGAVTVTNHLGVDGALGGRGEVDRVHHVVHLAVEGVGAA